MSTMSAALGRGDREAEPGVPRVEAVSRERRRAGDPGRSHPTRPRVLVVDDDPVVLAVTARVLSSKGFPCGTVADGGEAVERVVAFGADVVLLDVHMRPISGSAVLRGMRADRRTALVPVICVTGDRDPATLVALLGAGADDFIGKPFNAEELEARILVAVRRRDILLSVNPLTGLPGNLVLVAAIDERLAHGEGFALLHVDIDRFKAYNDQHGFVVGDEMIALVGRILSRTIDELEDRACVVAHIGGDDFALLVPPDHAERAARAIVASFDRAVAELPAGPGGQGGAAGSGPSLSLSIGVATTRRRTFASSAAMAEAAVESKAVVKEAAGSGFAVDRRRS
jgi:diguanylate cyclase (GGDEF)-like protein